VNKSLVLFNVRLVNEQAIDIVAQNDVIAGITPSGEAEGEDCLPAIVLKKRMHEFTWIVRLWHQSVQ
jgi:hypothetical protein